MYKRRMKIFFLVMLILFIGIDTRLGWLATRGSSVQTADTHGSYSLKIESNRGTIYDRNLEPMVNNNLKYVAAVSPQVNPAEQLRALSPHVSDISVLEEGLNKRLPFTVTVDTPNIDAPGVSVFTKHERYSENQLAPHIIGYVDSSGSGVAGIEKAYDDVLKEYSGSITRTYAVDAKRRALAGVEAKTTATGNSKGGVVLTLDSDIQKAAQTAADKYLKSGCVIVMNVKNGDILASVSEPEYSPLNVSAALKGTDSPLLNRVFSSYNLGSAFKIAVAATALESGIDPSFSCDCTGVIDVSGRAFHCEKTAGHGKEDMALAFANSCNPYFITIGLKTGGDKILEMAQRLGFGKKTVFAPGLSSEAGTLPTSEQLTSPAAVANLSMGQGELMVTPVQVACMVSAVANGGYLPTARLVKGIYDGQKLVTEYPNAVPDRVLSERIADKVSGFMIKTVNEGTGVPAKPKYGGAGGKTATAETGWLKDGKTINQAWFAGFYPAENPKYAIVVMCEDGRAGGTDAGPVFKYIADSLAPSCGYPAVEQ